MLLVSDCVTIHVPDEVEVTSLLYIPSFPTGFANIEAELLDPSSRLVLIHSHYFSLHSLPECFGY